MCRHIYPWSASARDSHVQDLGVPYGCQAMRKAVRPFGSRRKQVLLFACTNPSTTSSGAPKGLANQRVRGSRRQKGLKFCSFESSDSKHAWSLCWDSESCTLWPEMPICQTRMPTDTPKCPLESSIFISPPSFFSEGFLRFQLKKTLFS